MCAKVRGDKMKATKTMTKDMDMTSGPLLKKLIAVSLPLALSGILQLLFNAADLIVIGRFSETGTQSLAAVSSNVALINLVINVVIGLSIGTNVVMSQAIGRKDEDRAQRTVHTSLLIAVISGVAVGIVGVFCARYFLVWMKTDPEILDKATAYLSIYFIGTPANVLYNFGASILRAKGDTKRPLVYLSIAGAVNVVLNLIFVIVARLDVKGVAIATIVSQYISCIFIIIALLREKGYCRFALKNCVSTSASCCKFSKSVCQAAYSTRFSQSPTCLFRPISTCLDIRSWQAAPRQAISKALSTRP